MPFFFPHHIRNYRKRTSPRLRKGLAMAYKELPTLLQTLPDYTNHTQQGTAIRLEMSFTKALAPKMDHCFSNPQGGALSPLVLHKSDTPRSYYGKLVLSSPFL